MKLKFKLENLDDLSDEQKAMYQEKDGAFYLQVDGMPQGEDVTGLKAKLETLLNEKKVETDKARTEAEKARQAEEDAAKNKGDFEALANSYKQKIEALEQTNKDLIASSAQKEISKQASLISADLAEGPNQEIISTFIEKRLRLDGDELKVTDEKGNLTISTVDQLKEEFRNNAKFGALVIASKASGGGAGGSSNGGGAAKKFSELNEKERTDLYNQDKAEYRRLRDAEKP